MADLNRFHSYKVAKGQPATDNYSDLTIYKPLRWLQENVLTKHVGPLASQLFQCSSYNDR